MKNSLFYGLEPTLTDEQRTYLDSIQNYQLTICNAKAGTGKTTLAVMISRILGYDLRYIFTTVEEGTLGFTPGDVHDKEAKYLMPLHDALDQMNEKSSLSIYSPENPPFINEQTWIKAHSHVFARGTNIKDCLVIIDEAQNFTLSELRKTLTRIHDSCKVVLIGHDKQIDLKNPLDSGFNKYIEHFRSKPYANVVELTKNFRGRLASDADEV